MYSLGANTDKRCQISSTVQSAPLHCLNCVVDVRFQYRTSVGRRPISEASRGILVNSASHDIMRWLNWNKLRDSILFHKAPLCPFFGPRFPTRSLESLKASTNSISAFGRTWRWRQAVESLDQLQPGNIRPDTVPLPSTMFAWGGLTFCALEYGKNVQTWKTCRISCFFVVNCNLGGGFKHLHLFTLIFGDDFDTIFFKTSWILTTK